MTKKQKQRKNVKVTMNSKYDKLNPLYFKGYNDGFEAGKKAACERFADGFENLQNEKGIGKKTLIKFINAMGISEYVEEVKK